MKGSILVVDDDRDVLLSARVVLKRSFGRVEMMADPERIPSFLEKESVDVVLLDMNFTPGASDGSEGLHWLKYILEKDPGVQVVMMTAYGDINLAVEAMKQGAADFVVKPWDNQKLLATVRSCFRHSQSEREIRKLEDTRRIFSSGGDLQMVGRSKPMRGMEQIILKVAPSDASVLITGENGTGKELVARMLHRHSTRADQVFLPVDLGAVPETLFETELFGHTRGAFTDAREDRAGKFELASGGTLFLDEIGNLSPAMQAKLLAVLQNREVTRVGASRSEKVDIRLISATNMPLDEMVREGRFRQDLLYRINTVVIHVPPLRNRAGDIPLLVEHFAGVYGRKYKKNIALPGNEVFRELETWHWPGNVRELQHMVERAVIMSTGEKLSFSEAGQYTGQSAGTLPGLNLEELEKQAIMQAIEKYGGNLSRAAEELGLGRTTLYRKIEKYGLPGGS